MRQHSDLVLATKAHNQLMAKNQSNLEKPFRSANPGAKDILAWQRANK
jgi:hypothetical protein